MKIFDNFTQKALEKSADIEIISINENTHPNLASKVVCITFKYKDIPLHLYQTLPEDKDARTKKVLMNINMRVEKYKVASKKGFCGDLYKLLVEELVKLGQYKNAPNFIQDAYNHSGTYGARNRIKRMINSYKDNRKKIKYEEIYIHCIEKLYS